MPPRVIVDVQADEPPDYGPDHAVVVVDVIRSTTTAITAVALGRTTYPVPSLEVAVPLAARLHDPLLVGELGGSMPYGFHLNNSPAGIAARQDVERPMILLSTSGTRVMTGAARTRPTYLASLRNVSALARYLADRHATVAFVGAETRGQFREEDQLCCARLAERLVAAGCEADERAIQVMARWHGAPNDAFVGNASCRYLESTGQEADLDFILEHDDDLSDVFVMREGEVVRLAPDRPTDSGSSEDGSGPS